MAYEDREERRRGEPKRLARHGLAGGSSDALPGEVVAKPKRQALISKGQYNRGRQIDRRRRRYDFVQGNPPEGAAEPRERA
jgi:hypothetical protein